MKLLKELNLLKEGLDYNDIIIEDHHFAGDNISFTGKGEAKVTGLVLNGYFDGVRETEDNTNPTFKAKLNILIEYGEEDNSFSYAYGSEIGNSPNTAGKYTNPYDTSIRDISYVDTHGHRSRDIPKEVITAFGSEEAAQKALSVAFDRYVKAIHEEFTPYLFIEFNY